MDSPVEPGFSEAHRGEAAENGADEGMHQTVDRFLRIEFAIGFDRLGTRLQSIVECPLRQ